MFEHKSPILLVCLALTVNPSRFKKEKGNKFFCCLVCIMPEGLHCLGWKGTLIGSEGLGRDCQGKHYGFSKDELRDSYTKLNAKKKSWVRARDKIYHSVHSEYSLKLDCVPGALQGTGDVAVRNN